MANIYRTALQVQDASNPSGVILSLSREILPGIQAEPQYREIGTKYIYTHPAYILFIDKLASLIPGVYLHETSMQVADAYEACRTFAEGLEAVEARKLRDAEQDEVAF